MYAGVPSRDRRLFFSTLVLVAGAVSIVGVSQVAAATLTWQVSSGDWMSSANWGGALPTSSDTALVAGGTATIASDGPTCSTVTITGTGELVKTGRGKLILSGSNSFTGGLAVHDGILQISNPNALPTGANLSVGAFSYFGEQPAVATDVASPVPVPEPGSLCLLLAAAIVGCLPLALARRR